MTCRPRTWCLSWQWRHVGGQFWNSQRQLRICGVSQNLPEILEKSTELEKTVEEIFQMYNDVNTALKEFHTPRALFTHSHKRDPTELAGAEATPTETPQDNVVRSPLLTHLSLTNLPIVYAIEAPAYPTPCTHADAISAAHLASDIN